MDVGLMPPCPIRVYKYSSEKMLKQRHIPIRTCVACRETDEKRDLLRVVRQPDGMARFDPKGKLTGRGAYVCARAACITLARKQKKLERSLKISTVPPDVFDELNAQAALILTQEPTQEPISSPASFASEPTANDRDVVQTAPAPYLQKKDGGRRKSGPKVNTQESDHAGVTDDVATKVSKPDAARAPHESEAENA